MCGLCLVLGGLGRPWRGEKSGPHHGLFMVCGRCQVQGSSGSPANNVLTEVCTHYNGKEQKGNGASFV